MAADFTRRGALALPAALAATPAVAAAGPKPFLWGVSTAGHQIDGGNFNSDYWVLEHLKSTNFKEPSGDACDSWERWGEDLELVRRLGVNAYRFSLEWARIEPEEGRFSAATLEKYRRMCAACLERDIFPMVTFHHFSSPRWLAARGGWADGATPDRFARYAERTARALGDLMALACTMNEPNAQVTSYILRGDKPYPGEASVIAEASAKVGSDRFHSYFMGESFTVRDVCLAAHAKGRDAIRAAAPGVPVGLTLALQDLAAGPGGEALYTRVFENARRPFYEAARADDFLGVQPYMRLRLGPNGYLPRPADVIANQDDRDASPDALEVVVREGAENARVPIYVTENGIDTADDTLRVRHIPGALESLDRARAAGLDVRGYFHWSLLDNFEWRSGYGPRFGLYAVDRITFKRTPKPSAQVYAKLVRARRRLR